MKNIIITCAMALLVSGTMDAQKISDKDVPGNVKSAFWSKYPYATDTHWQRESATEYEVAFKTDNIAQSAKYDHDAKRLETETRIVESSLPAVILDKLHTVYGTYKIRETEKVETCNAGILYELEMVKDKNTIEVRFSPAGTVLSTE